MKIFLVRHATPDAKIYEAFPGPSLSDLGKKQAQQIADFLSTKAIDKIYASDYTRVIETLEPFQNFQKIKHINYEIDLREREKKTETHEQLVFRVENWFKKTIPTNNQSCNIAIFSHYGPINMLLFYLDKQRNILEYPFEDEFQCLTPKGSIWQLEIEAEKLLFGKLCLYN